MTMSEELRASGPSPQVLPSTRAHRSIFVKIVAVMMAMAVSLLALVTAFFGYAIGPNLHGAIDAVLERYTQQLAVRGVTETEAREISAQINLQIRHSGGSSDWTTNAFIPTAAELEQKPRRTSSWSLIQRNYYIAAAPDGGRYVFAWSLGRALQNLHTALLVSLLVVIIAVVALTYFIIQRILSPVRTLNEAALRLGAGDLTVSVPEVRTDELGQMTVVFNQMAQRIQKMIRDRDQLLADVSHELRSPLTRMKVALEFLPDDGRRAGMSKDISEMERLVSHLLELERLRSGRHFHFEPCDLGRLAHEVAALYRNVGPGVRVTAPSEAIAVVDGEKLRTVLSNLLDNATKYASPDSRPTEILITIAADTAEIRVTDDGPGIPADRRERLFEPFFRADPSRSKSTGGFGLGLSICKRIVEAHGGKISMDERLMEGTSFIVTLPRRVSQGTR